MNKKHLLPVIIIIVVIILLLAGIFLLKGTTHKTQTNNNTNTMKHVAPLPKEVTITLDKNGFSPTTVTIKVGSAVRWINKSGSQQTVNSDNYPTNQLHKELNFGVFNNGSSVTYTFTEQGTYGYHNQLHHEQEGKIIVEK